VLLTFLAFFGQKPAGEVKDLAVALLGPTVGVAGAVVGFYFGEKAESTRSR
jgi:hypothetical protein